MVPIVPYIVLGYGGRDYRDYQVAEDALRQLLVMLGHPFCVLDGAAPGADTLFHAAGETLGLPTMRMPANWNKFGKAAGSKRNQWMLDYGRPDFAIELPGGRGTADMHSRLVGANVPLVHAVEFVTVRSVN